MININGENWNFIQVSPDHPKLKKINGQFAIAVCNDNDKTVYINRYLDGVMLKKVIHHEVVHAVIFSYNIKIPREEEEFLANLISTYDNEIISITNKVYKKMRGRFF